MMQLSTHLEHLLLLQGVYYIKEKENLLEEDEEKN